MNLAQIISYLFPSAVAGKDYTLQDDGQGPYIKTWAFAGAAQPTDAQLTAAEAAAALAAAQATQAVTLSAACQSAITTGFSSAALGTAHAYGSQSTDQSNLLSAVGASNSAPAGWSTSLWCATGTPEVWALTAHDAAQVQQVNNDWLMFRTGLQQKYAGLLAQVYADDATVASVQAVVWA
jgi:hypothetical protein